MDRIGIQKVGMPRFGTEVFRLPAFGNVRTVRGGGVHPGDGVANLLLETGGALLLEDGGVLLLEGERTRRRVKR